MRFSRGGVQHRAPTRPSCTGVRISQRRVENSRDLTTFLTHPFCYLHHPRGISRFSVRQTNKDFDDVQVSALQTTSSGVLPSSDDGMNAASFLELPSTTSYQDLRHERSCDEPSSQARVMGGTGHAWFSVPQFLSKPRRPGELVRQNA